MKSLVAIMLLALAAPALPFDHQHATWSQLLATHVRVSSDGHASSIDYAGLKGQRAVLSAYLADLSAIRPDEYRAWSRDEQLAFLINAYNAWTVDLVLGHYPGLHSIKDLGGLFSSPWRRKFFDLLGERRSLDDVEHGLIRERGRFDEPRIHFAIVCASVGCPMLRAEAYVASQLDAQLEDGMRRFLGDRTRNRFDASTKVLEVSKIFDWYEEDFEGGSGRFSSLGATFSAFAEVLGGSLAGASGIRSGDYRLEFLSYDWTLNDTQR